MRSVRVGSLRRGLYATRMRVVRAMEGRPANNPMAPPSFFDPTRWRRKPPAGVTVGPKTPGERLRARRLKLGLSLEEAARPHGRVRVGNPAPWPANDLSPPSHRLAAFLPRLLSHAVERRLRGQICDQVGVDPLPSVSLGQLLSCLLCAVDCFFAPAACNNQRDAV